MGILNEKMLFVEALEIVTMLNGKFAALVITKLLNHVGGISLMVFVETPRPLVPRQLVATPAWKLT